MRTAIRFFRSPLALPGLAILLVTAEPSAAAPPNPAFCYNLFNEFNKCNRHAQRHADYGWGHNGGWGAHDDGYGANYGDPYGPPRWRGHPRRQQADCSRWLVAMQLNRCTE